MLSGKWQRLHRTSHNKKGIKSWVYQDNREIKVAFTVVVFSGAHPTVMEDLTETVTAVKDADFDDRTVNKIGKEVDKSIRKKQGEYWKALEKVASKVGLKV